MKGREKVTSMTIRIVVVCLLAETEMLLKMSLVKEPIIASTQKDSITKHQSERRRKISVENNIKYSNILLTKSTHLL